MVDSTTALRLTGVGKNYRGFRLQDIHLELPAGSIMGFVGPNGAGKTTTIRIITNLARPDTGTVEVLGRCWDAAEVWIKNRLGYVPESNHLYESVTGNWLGNFLRRYYPTWDDAYFRALLEKFRVPGATMVKNLSKGDRAKLAVALALAHRPRLLILDEPTAGVDPVVRYTLLQELLEVIQEETRAVLFSTHIVSDLERIADLVSYIVSGRIVLSGEKDVILEKWHLVSFSLQNPAALEQVRRLLPYVKTRGREGRKVEGVTGDFSPRLLQELVQAADGEVNHRPLNLEEIMVVLTDGNW
ncbi:MAG: ABC transporter ATP-binding protein [Armatimonadetes bacterium]|nr:ABC transporter ATP-binding protein [Armatimonadota bacterium]